MASVKLRIAAGLAVLGAALAITSCSNGDEHSGHASSTTPTAEQQGSPHNANDVAFAQGMIPHHQQALALAALVPDRSTNPEVIKIASGISAQQEPEITAMRAMLIQWQVDPAEASHHDMGMAQGMVDEATMAKLATLKGAPFDTLWLQSMIAHHEGAIAMAKVEIAQGQSQDMIVMANNIVIVQQAEIGQLKQILGG